MTLLKIITILNLCSIYHVSAHSGGAPTVGYPQVCSNMNPSAGHPPSTAAMPSPYSVNVDKDYFAPGEEVTVTITGNTNFNGILLQGREKGTDKVVGSFSALSLKLRNALCPNLENNQTVTHRERINMNTISVKWSPPADVSSLGNVLFLATVVQSQTIYWVKLESRQLSNSMKHSLISTPLQPFTSMPLISMSVYVGVTKATRGVDPSRASFPNSTSVYVEVNKATGVMKPTPSINGTMKMSSFHVSTTKKTTTTTCCKGYAFISNVFVTVVCVMFVIGQLL